MNAEDTKELTALVGDLRQRVRELEHAEEKRRQVEEELRDGERKYRQLVETLNEGIWVIDGDANTTFVNPRMAQMLGYTTEEMLGKHLFFFMDEKAIEMCIYKLERRKQGIKEQHDFELLCKDGRRIYTNMETSPIFDDNGNYQGALAGVTDITERKLEKDQLKQYGETLEVLLREINHRVKNNLTILLSVIHMLESRVRKESGGGRPCLEALYDLESRVKGLSIVHNMLSSSQWRPLKLKEMCREVAGRVVAQWRGKGQIQLEVADSEVEVKSGIAHHLALVLNELGMNAVKHAFSNMTEGRITIGINVDEYDNLLIRFSDNGPGFPADVLDGTSARLSIGYELVRGIVKKSLAGEVTFLNDNGAAVEIRVPARSYRFEEERETHDAQYCD